MTSSTDKLPDYRPFYSERTPINLADVGSKCCVYRFATGTKDVANGDVPYIGYDLEPVKATIVGFYHRFGMNDPYPILAWTKDNHPSNMDFGYKLRSSLSKEEMDAIPKTLLDSHEYFVVKSPHSLCKTSTIEGSSHAYKDHINNMSVGDKVRHFVSVADGTEAVRGGKIVSGIAGTFSYSLETTSTILSFFTGSDGKRYVVTGWNAYNPHLTAVPVIFEQLSDSAKKSIPPHIRSQYNKFYCSETDNLHVMRVLPLPAYKEDKPPKFEEVPWESLVKKDPAPSFWDLMKADLNKAAYRSAATQITKGTKQVILSMMNKSSAESIKAMSELLDTEGGSAIMSFMLGLGLTYVPQISDDPRAEKLASEFRSGGMSIGMDAIFNVLMESLVPVIQEAVASVPQENVRITNSSLHDEEENVERPHLALMK